MTVESILRIRLPLGVLSLSSKYYQLLKELWIMNEKPTKSQNMLDNYRWFYEYSKNNK